MDFTGPVPRNSLQCSSERRIIVGETLISQFTYPELGIEPCKDSCPTIGTDDATQAYCCIITAELGKYPCHDEFAYGFHFYYPIPPQNPMTALIFFLIE